MLQFRTTQYHSYYVNWGAQAKTGIDLIIWEYKWYCVIFRNQQHDKAEKEFVCEKLKLLTQTEFREKLDKHLYQMVGALHVYITFS